MGPGAPIEWGSWGVTGGLECVCVEPGFLMGVGLEPRSFGLVEAWHQQRFSDGNT